MKDAAPHRHNRASLWFATLQIISRLPAERVAVVTERLEKRGPCVCVGYTLHTGSGGEEQDRAVSTFTKPIKWQTESSMDMLYLWHERSFMEMIERREEQLQQKARAKEIKEEKEA